LFRGFGPGGELDASGVGIFEVREKVLDYGELPSVFG
jgi:hypothetical protein